MKTIQEICAEYGIKNYTINPDGTVDVQGGVDLCRYKMTKLPLEFGKVSGDFSCHGIGLTTLEGCPKEVNGVFNCSGNEWSGGKLSSLEGFPKNINGFGYTSPYYKGNLRRAVFCSYNHKLTSLEGLEKDTNINGEFWVCDCDNLYSLDGFPTNFKFEFYCARTPIASIYYEYIFDTYIEGTNQLTEAINFFNQLRVIEEYGDGWRIHYRSFLDYLKRYPEFDKPTKEELQALVGNYYIVK